MLWPLLLGCAAPPAAPQEPPTPPALEPVAAPEPVGPPTFSATTRPLSAAEKARMAGTTFKPGCPVALEDLARIELDHHTFDGTVTRGAIVVRKDVAPLVVEAFRAAFDEGFPFERVEPIEVFDGSDQRSMNANNTSAFNCRPITGGSRYSEHSYGNAIDVNPMQNPYISASGKTVLPKGATAFIERTPARPGMLLANSAFVTTLVDAGWGWGGTWTRTRDFQHVSETGR